MRFPKARRKFERDIEELKNKMKKNSISGAS